MGAYRSENHSAGGLAEAPDERARMGRVSGCLWMVGAAVGVGSAFLPGAAHEGMVWVVALSFVIFLYGLGSATGVIAWQRASMNALAAGMAVTIPVLGLAVYLTGASLSYIEPLMVCSLLYAAFFFPTRWAWPLAVELIAVAGLPLLYDPGAVDNAFVARWAALAVAYMAATWVMVELKRRLVDAEVRQRTFANRDPLTGVGNRRVFDTTMRRELAARQRPRGARRGTDASPLALLIFDLDDFKGVNDTHGHPVGDAVLRDAAERARAILRSTDTLARIGGDEFAVIAPGAHGEGARRLAEAIGTAVARRPAGTIGPVPTVSTGWAVYPDDGADFETLMHAADERLLRRKGEGRRVPERPRASKGSAGKTMWSPGASGRR